MVQGLIRKGNVVDAKDDQGMTPLACAATWSRLAELQQLIRRVAASVGDAVDEQSRAPSSHAGSSSKATYKSHELIQRGPVIDLSDRTPLSFVAVSSKLDAIQALLQDQTVANTVTSKDRTPLLLHAARKRSSDVGTLHGLLRNGAIVDSTQERLGRLCCHLAHLTEVIPNWCKLCTMSATK